MRLRVQSRRVGGYLPIGDSQREMRGGSLTDMKENGFDDGPDTTKHPACEGLECLKLGDGAG